MEWHLGSILDLVCGTYQKGWFPLIYNKVLPCLMPDLRLNMDTTSLCSEVVRKGISGAMAPHLPTLTSPPLPAIPLPQALVEAQPSLTSS